MCLDSKVVALCIIFVSIVVAILAFVLALLGWMGESPEKSYENARELAKEVAESTNMKLDHFEYDGKHGGDFGPPVYRWVYKKEQISIATEPLNFFGCAYKIHDDRSADAIFCLDEK